MTEAEWLTSGDFRELVRFVQFGSLALYDDAPAEIQPAMREHLLRLQSRRRFALFGCACCRSIWPLLSDARSRVAIETTESYLDGRTDERDWMAAWGEADQARQTVWLKRFASGESIARAKRVATVAACRAVSLSVMDAAGEAATAIAWSAAEPELGAAEAQLANLFRDIFGNPFRPVEFNASWRTGDVVDLARGVYEERAFERLPLLADALMDAGCGDEQVLGHCRGDGPHVRGCWVVDLVLGKE
jgi:hypothetical protein